MFFYHFRDMEDVHTDTSAEHTTEDECFDHKKEQRQMVMARREEKGIQTSIASKNLQTKKRKGRGPTKSLGKPTLMTLEYDQLGQPCGKWRQKYAMQIGICMHKLSILHSWKEVPESLKKMIWEDTMNQFHIPNDEAKKNLFLSAVAQRFRDFKAKLVSGWITKRRKVGGTKKKKIYDGEATPSSEASHDTSFEDPSKLPYQIWRHITAEQWHAFVAQKTTTPEVVVRIFY
ncbi:uncharacterized protein LOC130590996 isoform X1 [Beta vulgaris subsp. vulgaris]|uniref:uncharacterized protein LOC130590996 isoform X1 n=1 Tax=Beta vulgaris subsp. vulgaris TaxID=3555 RepID=UPI002547FFDE|nr:uncharacterized protein LOC130590996 isoform X1 [Beta vulgaris subsp. vulgaris]